jgi:hypothetical protein
MITGGILGDEPITAASMAEACERAADQARAEAAAAAYAAELRKRCSDIDLFADKNMHAELEKQRVVLRPADRARFRELLEFCREYEWPHSLPIMPHALYEHIVSESDKGYKHVLSIVKSIAKIHEAAGEDICPSRDPLVKAYLELVREDETKTIEKGNDNG